MTKDGVIVDQGRPGTKWLLVLFDYSSLIFCRNEPDEILTSQFKAFLQDRDVVPHDWTILENKWEQAVASVSLSMGERDLVIDTRKNFIYNFSYVLGIQMLWNCLGHPR